MRAFLRPPIRQIVVDMADELSDSLPIEQPPSELLPGEEEVMVHVIEVTARPYGAGSPRRYYASDYPLGAVVVFGDDNYEVRDADGVAVFVAI